MGSNVSLLLGVLLLGGLTLYFAVRSREVRKFLAGAFFVSSGMQFYFYLIHLPVPVVGTDLVQSPEVSGVRSLIHFALFMLTFYSGFLRKQKRP